MLTSAPIICSISPYFFNAGLISSGLQLNILCSAYAHTIAQGLSSPTEPIPQFDILFGPAYKGIPLAACTSLLLQKTHNISTSLAYDRKEAKDHGEGGNFVGAPVKGKKVLVLDDVMTAGTAVRKAVEMIRREGGEVVGIVQCLDREEITGGEAEKERKSTAMKLEEELGGKGRVRAILRMRDLITWLEEKGRKEELENMKVYFEKYGANN